MTAVFVLAVLVGLDNLQVAAAIGLMPMPARRRVLLAAVFGLCEGLMPLLGLFLGHGLLRFAGSAAQRVGTATLAVCGATVLYMALREQDVERLAESRSFLFGLPVSLSFDNLFAGVGLGTLGAPIASSALVVGAVSTLLCLLGLYGGVGLRRLVPERAEVLSGVFLLGLAFLRLFEGAS